jgi:ribonuclease E
MRRLIIGAMALGTGVAAAIGLAIRRRRGHQDDVLPLEPAPPLLATPQAGSPEAAAASASAPSVETDFGATAERPVAPKRRRQRRKPAGAKVSEAETADVSGSPVESVAELAPDVAATAEPTTTAKRRRRPRRKPAAASPTESPEPGETPEAADSTESPETPEPTDSPGAS